MNIEVTQLNEVAVARLSGELDGRTAPQVEAKLLPLVHTGSKILLQMENVTYMSSAGLRMLLLLYRQISAKEGQVVLVGLQEMLRDTMSITGFLDFFEDYPTLNEGLAALN